eukprot:GHVU01119583.1.p1 GENE.GHVU01119583.1~~GHVU01119583.1.p1  ORF type:complete len:220 (+),score=26.00 GHVU01119583.1:549-1208(+)
MWPPPVSSSFPFDDVVGSGPAQQPRQEARVPGPTASILGQHRTSSAFDLDFTAAAAGLPPPPLAPATDAAGSADTTTPGSAGNRLTPPLMLVVVFGAITGLLMGYDLCVVAVVLTPVEEDFQICGGRFTCAKKQLFVALVAPGAAMGSLVAGVLSDRFGRRLTLAASDVCFILGSALMGLGSTYAVLLLGRIFVGVGVGGEARLTHSLTLPGALPPCIA